MLFQLMLLSFSSGVVMNGKNLDDYYHQIDQISRSVDGDGRHQAKAISRIYTLRVLPIQHEKFRLPDADLHTLFATTDLAYFYAVVADYGNAAPFLNQLDDDFVELERRGVATTAEITTAYEALVRGREFGRALALRKRHQSVPLDHLPMIDRTSGYDEALPGAFSLSDDGKSLVLRNIDIARNARVVVVAGCHFSRDAAVAIKADPALTEAFRKGRAVWIESVSNPLSTKDLRTWNDEFPDQPLSVAYNNAAWRQVDFSMQPAFFFFKDGKLMSKRSGWSKRRSDKDWRESLRELGLLE